MVSATCLARHWEFMHIVGVFRQPLFHPLYSKRNFLNKSHRFTVFILISVMHCNPGRKSQFTWSAEYGTQCCIHMPTVWLPKVVALLLPVLARVTDITPYQFICVTLFGWGQFFMGRIWSCKAGMSSLVTRWPMYTSSFSIKKHCSLFNLMLWSLNYCKTITHVLHQ